MFIIQRTVQVFDRLKSELKSRMHRELKELSARVCRKAGQSLGPVNKSFPCLSSIPTLSKTHLSKLDLNTCISLIA